MPNMILSSSSEMQHKQERVKARWSILRKALLSSTADSYASVNGVSSHSMNSFPGFGVLDRSVISVDRTSNGAEEEWDNVQNSYTTLDGTCISFPTREVKHNQLLQRKALLSHRDYGVDNTGNVRVWDAESSLAGFLLSVIFDTDAVENDLNDVNQTDFAEPAVNLISLKNNLRLMLVKTYADENNPCNVLELGAGQAGLAGLALIAAAITARSNPMIKKCKNSEMKHLRLELTDGHPNCVKNNKVCAQMISESAVNGNDAFNIDTRLLLWDSSPKVESCHQIERLFQLCLASDCVHFQEFHDGLFMTIGRTLAVNGIALMCQPNRGPSLENFMSLVNYVNNGGDVETHRNGRQLDPLFEMTLLDDFHPKVSLLHHSLLHSEHPSKLIYKPDWHRPLLLCLKKIRVYDEESDGILARHHIKSYCRTTDKEKNHLESNRLAPFNPTHLTAQSRALELLNLQSNDIFFDLGCGDGQLLVLALNSELKRGIDKIRGLKCIGIECDKPMAEIAQLNVEKILSTYRDVNSSEKAYVRWGDVMDEMDRGNDTTRNSVRLSDEKINNPLEHLTLLNDATAVFVYLLPEGLQKVKPLLLEAAKRRRQYQLELAQKNSMYSYRVVSYMFAIPGWEPTLVDKSSKGGCPLYYYSDVDRF